MDKGADAAFQAAEAAEIIWAEWEGRQVAILTPHDLAQLVMLAELRTATLGSLGLVSDRLREIIRDLDTRMITSVGIAGEATVVQEPGRVTPEQDAAWRRSISKARLILDAVDDLSAIEQLLG